MAIFVRRFSSITPDETVAAPLFVYSKEQQPIANHPPGKLAQNCVYIHPRKTWSRLRCSRVCRSNRHWIRSGPRTWPVGDKNCKSQRAWIGRSDWRAMLRRHGKTHVAVTDDPSTNRNITIRVDRKILLVPAHSRGQTVTYLLKVQDSLATWVKTPCWCCGSLSLLASSCGGRLLTWATSLHHLFLFASTCPFLSEILNLLTKSHSRSFGSTQNVIFWTWFTLFL